MKWIIIVTATLLAATQNVKYADAFAEERYEACQKAKEAARNASSEEIGGCSCEKIDYEGWRCLVRYSAAQE